jgi:hypothetical protein
MLLAQRAAEARREAAGVYLLSKEMGNLSVLCVVIHRLHLRLSAVLH